MENPVFGFGQEDDAVHEVWRIRVLEQVCSTCVSFRFFAAFVLLRETERLWEIWLIAKTAFPSPRWDICCAGLVGAARSRHTRERREGQNQLNEASSCFAPC